MICRKALASAFKIKLRVTCIKSTTEHRQLLLLPCTLLQFQHSAGLGGNAKGFPELDTVLTEKQMDEIFLKQPQIQCVPAHRITKFSQMLINSGFSTTSVKKILIRIPRILDAPCEDVLEVINIFKKTKISENDLVMAINECPELLMLMPEAIEMRLKEINSCFTKGDARELLECCPNVFLDSWQSITAKIRYILFEMGMEQRDIVVSDALRYGLEFLRVRHQVLLRCGKYKKPDPKNRRAYKGLSLKEILRFPELAFVKCAGITIEEYVMLEKILEEEEEEEEDDSDEEQVYRR